MSYGAPDRGGGREGKKTSLRKSKVNAADAAKKAHAKPRDERPETSPTAPPVRYWIVNNFNFIGINIETFNNAIFCMI